MTHKQNPKRLTSIRKIRLKRTEEYVEGTTEQQSYEIQHLHLPVPSDARETAVHVYLGYRRCAEFDEDNQPGQDYAIVRVGDGYKGWPEYAPFDAIIVTAAPDHIPQPLIDQLKPGGRMVIPVGKTGAVQQLKRLTKQNDGSVREEILDLVRFVPMTGEAEKNRTRER